MPLFFQVSLLAPLILASIGFGFGLSDFYLWLWPMWTGSLLAAVLFYFLNGSKGFIAKHKEKRTSKAPTKSTPKVSFGLVSLLIIGIIVFYANFWGFAAVADFPPSISFFSESSVVDTSPNQFDSLENDHEALEIIAGTYREEETFLLQLDGALEPLTSPFNFIYTFNQDRTFTIFQDENSLLNAGDFIDPQTVFFMLRSSDGHIVIYNATFGNIAVVEQLQ